MKRRALGKGLGSLLPERQPVAVETESLIQIGVDEIRPNPGQPRVSFETKSLGELAESIRGAGVLQPILVRELGSGYELIAGERRLRAARMAGLRSIPARVQRVDGERSVELALIENIQREELNPMEEARAFEHLTRDRGLTQEEIGRRVGRSRSSVANSLRLLRLPGRVQEMLESGLLTAGHAKALLSLDGEATILEAAEQLAHGSVSVRQAEGMVREKTAAGPRAVRPEAGQDPNVRAAEERLMRVLGTKVRIKQNAEGRGRIEISFHSDEELERLFEQLEGQIH